MEKCALRIIRNLFLSSILLALSVAVCAQDAAKVDAPKTEEPKVETPKVETPKVDPLKVVAKVGDKNITEEQLQKEIAEQSKRFPGAGIAGLPEETLQEMRRVILNHYIDRMLILDAAQTLKLEATEEQIAKEFAGIKERFPDEKVLQSALEKQGKTMDDLKSDIKEGLTIRSVIEKVTESVAEPKEEELKKFYDENPDRFTREEQVKASHILLSVKKEATDEEKGEIKKKITEIREKIVKGEDFAKLAADHSECPSGKREGGDLGWFGHDQMVPEFEKVAFALKVGELSDVVETEFGYHIIKLTEKKDAGVVAFADAREELKEELVNKVKGESFMKWLENEKLKKVTWTDPKDKPEAEEPKAEEPESKES
ncbi:MAG TPA: peptidylprolyl isomerase, partial [Candidatus Sumerlaeota bacterium]|nr:peptidylprolyl isomerase [Candidatus Sumerlaeota bacterium]